MAQQGACIGSSICRTMTHIVCKWEQAWCFMIATYCLKHLKVQHNRWSLLKRKQVQSHSWYFQNAWVEKGKDSWQSHCKGWDDMFPCIQCLWYCQPDGLFEKCRGEGLARRLLLGVCEGHKQPKRGRKYLRGMSSPEDGYRLSVSTFRSSNPVFDIMDCEVVLTYLHFWYGSLFLLTSQRVILGELFFPEVCLMGYPGAMFWCLLACALRPMKEVQVEVHTVLVLSYDCSIFRAQRAWLCIASKSLRFKPGKDKLWRVGRSS